MRQKEKPSNVTLAFKSTRNHVGRRLHDFVWSANNQMVEIKSKPTEKILYKPKPNKLPKSNQKPKTNNQKRDETTWYVYLVQCNDNSLYTGVTNNLQKRMDAHTKGTGSKYVKAKGFKKLLNFKLCQNKIQAQQAEYKIKQLHKSEKINWFHQNK